MVVHILPLRLVSIEGEPEVLPTAHALLCAAGLTVSPVLLNNFMKPLGEIIHHAGTMYHQDADDAQLYIPVSGEPSNALGGSGGWMWDRPPAKMEGLWAGASSVS